MKKALLLAVAFLVFIPLGLSAQSDTPSEGYYAPSFARLTFVSGDVFVQRTSDLGTEKAEVNLALVRGDKLGTGAGQAEINFSHQNYLRLDNNTEVEFAVLPVAGDDRIQLHVLKGSAYLRVSALAGDKSIEVHTPDASTYVLEEGLYRFNVSANKQTEVIALEGSLEAAGEKGSVVVHSRQSLVASDGRLDGEPGDYDSRSDGFDQWNESRDALFAQRSTTRHLPSELGDYEEELDQNGRWTNEEPYGNVWVPNGIDDDWRPYMYGRWSWYPNIGWNWISSEPWGWSVYHYGRWSWRFGLGWYWIPQNHWGPAWVNWWWDNDYIGWCPLSWYNRPMVIFNNRYYDRYRDHYFPGNNRAMSVIRRDQFQSRDVGRHMLSAGERSHIGQISFRGEQPSIRPAIGRSSLQSPAAQRIFSGRSGIRGEAKNYAPRSSLSSSQPRYGRSSAADRGSGASSFGTRMQSGETIKQYPSSSRETASSWSSRSSASARALRSDSARSARTYPSRLTTQRFGTDRISQAMPRYNPRTYSYSRPSAPSYSNPRSYSYSRSNTYSYSRSSAPRYSAPSHSQSSYYAPSRSRGSSGRSYSARSSSRSSGSSRSRSSSSSSRSSSGRSIRR